jgi:hypothetical protein
MRFIRRTSKLISQDSKQLPDSIFDVTDDILSVAIICEKTGKPFRIIKSELEFYRRHKLPLPTIHPYERIKKMFSYMGNHLAINGVCDSCEAKLETIYKKEEGWQKLYCAECFQREVL